MIEAIFVSKKSKEELQRVNEVQVVMAAGITGDRYFKKARFPGQNITFIGQESIERYNSQYAQSIDIGATRRNIITKGVDLNALVGKDFSIGGAKFRGVELCQPCRKLAQLLANESISKTEVMLAFLHSGGLRADIIGGGIISTGMALIEK